MDFARSISSCARARCSSIIALAVLVVGLASTAPALVIPEAPTWTEMTDSAEQILRGTVISADVSTKDVAGGRVKVTTYTVVVAERLKGKGRKRHRFQQVGTPGGGPSDLGTLGGLATYETGQEYLFFLLPRSRYGLTSPAGGPRGALEIHDGKIRGGGAFSAQPSPAGGPRAGEPAAAHAGGTVSYLTVREVVRQRVQASQGGVR